MLQIQTTLLEEKMGQKLPNIGYGNELLAMTPKAEATRKNQATGFHKNFKMFVPQATINRKKGNLQNETKYLQIMYLDKGLTTRIQSTPKVQQQNMIQKWTKTFL